MVNLYEVRGRITDSLTDELLQAPGVRIERIVELGHVSPDDFWYDQDEHEWVAVLAGRARLQFADQDELLELGPGDHVNIPAGRRHRIAWSTPDEPTIWVAVFHR
ncbi:MAG: phosphoribosylaminoimidazole carboxylase [Planctomycetaceae bacterium]|nr:phosphoribosylaminoimidazole carboxylase [Planctomycetaceae bacterium]